MAGRENAAQGRMVLPLGQMLYLLEERMKKLGTFLMSSLIGLGSLLGAQAEAATGISPSLRPAAATSDVVNVEVFCDPYGCYDIRRPPPPPIYRRPPPPPPWGAPPGWDDGYHRPPPPPPIYRRPPPPPPPVYGGRSWDRHVQWCFSRYRSYNPETNRFLSSSGYFKVCRSPYY